LPPLPGPAVYDGRIRITAPGTLLADIDQAVSLGAAHITFADPDFLNGPHHSVRVIRGMHRRHPDLTFDVTTKIELILRHRDLWAELAAAGCLFVTTALECVDDHILAILDKGHTGADAADAVTLLRSAGIEPRPSLLPFTPWTTTSGLADLVDFAVEHHLFGNIDQSTGRSASSFPTDRSSSAGPSWRPTLTVTTPARSVGDGTPPIRRSTSCRSTSPPPSKA